MRKTDGTFASPVRALGALWLLQSNLAPSAHYLRDGRGRARGVCREVQKEQKRRYLFSLFSRRNDGRRSSETKREKNGKPRVFFFRLPSSSFLSFTHALCCSLSFPPHRPLSTSSYRSPRLCAARGMFLLRVATSVKSSSATETPTAKAPASARTSPHGETASECPCAT